MLFPSFILNSFIIFIYVFVCVLSFCHAGLASESGHQDSSKDHKLLSPLHAHFILSECITTTSKCQAIPEKIALTSVCIHGRQGSPFARFL